LPAEGLASFKLETKSPEGTSVTTNALKPRSRFCADQLPPLFVEMICAPPPY